jgi:lipoic acid synthetase
LEAGSTSLQEKPDWVKKKISLNNVNIQRVRKLILDLNLHTVCQSAKCPNIYECFSKNTATFMLMGDTCTRNCSFCGVFSGTPLELDSMEPEKISFAAEKMGLKYIVLTSVTRDDLVDGGAQHFASTVAAIKKKLPDANIECLIPDFKGEKKSLAVLLDEKLDVLNHNIETIRRNYKEIRAGADYEVSLDVLRSVKEIRPGIIIKSGFMLGLGEVESDIIRLLEDLKNAGVDIITIGQYLRPGKENTPVRKYYTPDEFKEIKKMALDIGFNYILSGIFVRSSYKASDAYKSVKERLKSIKNC